MTGLKFEELYELKVRGEKYITSCKLFFNGKQAAFGISKVDGRRNYNQDLGKKLALAMAFRFFVKTQCEWNIIDKTNEPVFEDDNLFEGKVEYDEV